jgi:hypothetical protein
MEANRYPGTTTRTYTEMEATFLRFINPKEAENCTSDDLIRFVDDYILPAGLSVCAERPLPNMGEWSML